LIRILAQDSLCKILIIWLRIADQFRQDSGLSIFQRYFFLFVTSKTVQDIAMGACRMKREERGERMEFERFPLGSL
jgi:hypothetical protein